ALVPLRLADALARGQHVEAFVSLGAQEVPSALQVANERMRLVLGSKRNTTNTRVQCVGGREVDDARLAAEIDGRLGAAVGEIVEPRAAPSREHIGHRLTSKWRWCPIVCHLSLLVRINPDRISVSAWPAAADGNLRRPASSQS